MRFSSTVHYYSFSSVVCYAHLTVIASKSIQQKRWFCLAVRVFHICLPPTVWVVLTKSLSVFRLIVVFNLEMKIPKKNLNVKWIYILAYFCLAFSGQPEPLEWVRNPLFHPSKWLWIYDSADADARLIIWLALKGFRHLNNMYWPKVQSPIWA